MGNSGILLTLESGLKRVHEYAFCPTTTGRVRDELLVESEYLR